MARTARADVGPLAEHAEGLRAELAGLGYTPDGVVRKLWEVGRLSDWMADGGLAAGDLTAGRLGEFSAACAAGGLRPVGPRALGPVLCYLRGRGVVPELEVGASPVEVLVGRYRRWLVEDRALAVRTVGRYEKTARRFLAERAATVGGDGVERLSGGDVNRFLLAECTRVSVGSAKGRVAELRSLLRFLFIEGLTEVGLAASVPPVAGWRDTALPSTLTRAQVEAIIGAAGTGAPLGPRNRAIVLLLARLGLRAAEVGGLQLGDIDWRAGELVVRGKGRRDERLPLPADAGEAIAVYLRDARPATPSRAVFVTRFAPWRALAPQTISKIVFYASASAGVGPPVCAHRLRHALATEMLAGGAVLAEISQVLRHRDLATTAVYAKVDHGALRTLAPAWPVTR
jgi:site-specific recombinase XerD